MDSQDQDDPVSAPAPAMEELQPLSRRQLEVLRIYAKGYTIKETAIYMRISPKTVETHLAHIRERWDVSRTVEAVVMAADRKLL